MGLQKRILGRLQVEVCLVKGDWGNGLLALLSIWGVFFFDYQLSANR